MYSVKCKMRIMDEIKIDEQEVVGRINGIIFIVDAWIRSLDQYDKEMCHYFCQSISRTFIEVYGKQVPSPIDKSGLH